MRTQTSDRNSGGFLFYHYIQCNDVSSRGAKRRGDLLTNYISILMPEIATPVCALVRNDIYFRCFSF